MTFGLRRERRNEVTVMVTQSQSRHIKKQNIIIIIIIKKKTTKKKKKNSRNAPLSPAEVYLHHFNQRLGVKCTTWML